VTNAAASDKSEAFPAVLLLSDMCLTSAIVWRNTSLERDQTSRKRDQKNQTPSRKHDLFLFQTANAGHGVSARARKKHGILVSFLMSRRRCTLPMTARWHEKDNLVSHVGGSRILVVRASTQGSGFS